MYLWLILIGVVIFGIYWKVRGDKEHREEIQRRDFELSMSTKKVELIEIQEEVSQEPGDIELTKDGLPVIRFSLPDSSNGTPRRVVVFGKRAEKLAGRLHKGDRVRVRARRKERTGNSGPELEFIANTIEIEDANTDI